MGTLSVQPPSGAVRSLTEVFILLRNNAVQSRQIFSEHSVGAGGSGEEKMTLVPLDGDKDLESGGELPFSARVPPEWVNMVDEIQYELGRARNKLKELKEMQQKHIMRPSFNDESSDEERVIEGVTQDITKMLSHSHRLIQHISAGSPKRRGDRHLLNNVTAALLQSLQAHTGEFRTAQTNYMKQLQNREDSFNQYFEAFDAPAGASSWSKPYGGGGSGTDDYLGWNSSSMGLGEEEPRPLTMAQIQEMEDNTTLVKDREREVLHIAKSIVELNQIFKDLAGFVTDQGSIVDRIDYNIEQSNIKVKAALKSVQKAESYQKKNRKMMCILCLSGTIIALLFIYLLTKIF